MGECAGGKCNVTGSGNISLGSHSGTKLTSGVCNVFAGHFAGKCNDSDSYNVFLAAMLVNMHLVAIVMLLLVIRQDVIYLVEDAMFS